MGKRSGLGTAERREIVLCLLRREEPGAQLARRHEISEATLYRWRDEFLAGGEAALTTGTGKKQAGQQRRISELEAEVAKRDQVIGELTIANRFLKKLSGPSD